MQSILLKTSERKKFTPLSSLLGWKVDGEKDNSSLPFKVVPPPEESNAFVTVQVGVTWYFGSAWAILCGIFFSKKEKNIIAEIDFSLFMTFC